MNNHIGAVVTEKKNLTKKMISCKICLTFLMAVSQVLLTEVQAKMLNCNKIIFEYFKSHIALVSGREFGKRWKVGLYRFN